MGKKQIKSFIAGVIVTSILFTVIIASPIKKNIEAFYNNIKIYVDGKLITPKDAAGNTVEPFAFNGTIYLPIRAIGNALDKNVEWDGKTYSVYVGKRNDKLNYLLNIVKAYQGDNYWELSGSGTDTFKMAGIEYSNGFKMSDHYDPAYALYNLNAQYTSISGKIGHIDGSDDYDRIVNFLGDGKLLKAIEVKSQALPLDFTLDVTGVMQLKMKIDDKSGSPDIGFGNVIID